MIDVSKPDGRRVLRTRVGLNVGDADGSSEGLGDGSVVGDAVGDTSSCENRGKKTKKKT